MTIYVSFIIMGSADGVWRSLVSRMVRDHEAAGSSPATPTMQSVLIGFEYPVMDTLFFIRLNVNRLDRGKNEITQIVSE